FQPLGRDQGELETAVECQQLDERMHRATVLQVANQSDMRTVEQLAQAGELREDGVEVQERLAGVLSGAVTAVHHRDISRTRELRDGTLFGMPNHHGVHIATHDTAGVIDGFTLRHRRKGETRGVANGSAQAAESGTEANARTGTRFEKQVA